MLTDKPENYLFLPKFENRRMKRTNIHFLVAALLILAAACSRIALYPHNFSPIIGMALFGGAVIQDKKAAFLLPLLAMLLSDIMFEISGIAPGFWGWGQLTGYGILATITLIGFTLKNRHAIHIAGYSIGSSILFYLLSNMAFFLIDNPIYHTYTQDLAGLKQCYIMALPFLRTGMIADLVFSALLFGSYFLLDQWVAKKESMAR
jgi:hypothetical protein